MPKERMEKESNLQTAPAGASISLAVNNDEFLDWFTENNTEALANSLDALRRNDKQFSASEKDVRVLMDCLSSIGAQETTWDKVCQTIATGQKTSK